MHAIGIDISRFNCMIADVKLLDYDLDLLIKDIQRIRKAITSFATDKKVLAFEQELNREINIFNSRYFPSPDFKYDVYRGKIKEDDYAAEQEKIFLDIYNKLIKKHDIKLKQDANETFLDKWYIVNVREEIDFAFNIIKNVGNINNEKLLAVILSRTIRSCRATTHSDLATLKQPQLTTYYCYKHKKICKPLLSIKYWFTRYANETLTRIAEFQRLRTDANSVVIPADSRSVNIKQEVKKQNKQLYEILMRTKIKGIFTSPPYVGQIDYHEQHAYAYDLFGFERQDGLEIGPLYKGKNGNARASYVEGISQVMLNFKKYLAADANIFMVANDKYNLYPTIAEQAGFVIVNCFKRPVLNRTERDKAPYSEVIFHLRGK